jgi:hypothetical protein
MVKELDTMNKLLKVTEPNGLVKVYSLFNLEFEEKEND